MKASIPHQIATRCFESTTEILVDPRYAEMTGIDEQLKNGGPRSISIIIPDELVLTIRLTIPHEAARDLKDAVPLIISSETPFSEDEIYYDYLLYIQNNRQGKFLNLFIFIVLKEHIHSLQLKKTKHLPSIKRVSTKRVQNCFDKQADLSRIFLKKFRMRIFIHRIFYCLIFFGLVFLLAFQDITRLENELNARQAAIRTTLSQIKKQDTENRIIGERQKVISNLQNRIIFDQKFASAVFFLNQHIDKGFVGRLHKTGNEALFSLYIEDSERFLHQVIDNSEYQFVINGPVQYQENGEFDRVTIKLR